jgi:hypothetical protein
MRKAKLPLEKREKKISIFEVNFLQLTGLKPLKIRG